MWRIQENELKRQRRERVNYSKWLQILIRGSCAIDTSTSVLANVIHHVTEVNSKMAEGRHTKTKFVFDYSSPNITHSDHTGRWYGVIKAQQNCRIAL